VIHLCNQSASVTVATRLKQHYSQAPEKNPYKIENTISAPEDLTPNIAKMRTPVIAEQGIKRLKAPNFWMT
jgi:hypothetical protein